MTMSDSIVEKVAATIAVPDLIRHGKTWGEWEDWQRAPYVRDARQVLRVVAEFIDAPSVMGDTGVIYVCQVCGEPIESEPCRDHMPIATAALAMSDLSDALTQLAIGDPA
jgi:hypothetical protein